MSKSLQNFRKLSLIGNNARKILIWREIEKDTYQRIDFAHLKLVAGIIQCVLINPLKKIRDVALWDILLLQSSQQVSPWD